MQDSSINPHHFLVDALTQLPRRGRMGTAFMAANRWMLAQFNKWAMDKTNGFYYAANISGQAVTMFQELPIVLVESLSGTEDAI